MKPEDIDVARDLVDVTFLMKSDVDPASIEYTVALKEWSATDIKFKFNFSNPLLLSRGEEQDAVLLKLKNPEMFVF